MESGSFKRALTRLTPFAFKSYVLDFFGSDPNGSFDRAQLLEEAGEDVFYLPYRDSYGGSIHNVYLVHFPPLELFRPNKPLNMADPTLIGKLHKVRDLYKGRHGRWGMVDPFLSMGEALQGVGFVTNLAGIERDVYDRTIIPAYSQLKRDCGLAEPRTFVGSVDSFVDKNYENAVQAYHRFVEVQTDGLAITFDNNGPRAREFVLERHISGGVISEGQLPYEPAFLKVAVKHRDLLEQFDRLLLSSSSEKALEDFLATNYRDLFGFEYDRIETQLWLSCPDLDRSHKDRRIDLFLRNCISNDWELFELKRASVPLSRTVRDVPVLSRHVVEAVHQVKNYSRLLAQDKIRKHFAQRGIEYFEPRLTVVIGRNPTIPRDQWRWLQASNEGHVALITYDDLRRELTSRIEDRLALLESARM